MLEEPEAESSPFPLDLAFSFGSLDGELFALIYAPAAEILVSDLQGPGRCRGEVEASQGGSLVLNLERSQQRSSFKP